MTIDYSSNNVFVDNAFERWAEKRTNPEWVERRLADCQTRFVGIWQHRCALADERLHYFDAAQLSDFDLDKAFLLGNVNGAACFGYDFGETPSPPESVAHYDYQGLRGIGMTLDESSAALSAYAQAMVFWHRRHQFCGSCGSPTQAMDAGHVLKCTACKHRSFPRSDPAVIVLAARDDKVLLGRQASWPPGRYSTIAGFVEPGESLEATVRREVAEETGHSVTKVRYFSSQPWPFPSSLMLGFSATVSAEPTCEPDEELEDIRWFTRQDIIDRETNGPKLVPPPLSIAYRLVEHWFNLGSDIPLAEITQD